MNGHKDMDINTMANIYNHFADEESKMIFENRLLHSISSKQEYIKKLVQKTCQGRRLQEHLTEPGKQYVLVGLGHWGTVIYNMFEDINWKCCTDNIGVRNGKISLQYIPIQNLLKNVENRDVSFVIATRNSHQEIVGQLKKAGIHESKIIDVGETLDELYAKQYFDLPALHVTENEIFIDGGGFDGKSSINFLKWCSNQYKKIILFEPDVENYEVCYKMKNTIERFECYKSGLWSEESILAFREEGTVASAIDSNGENEISVIRLDDVIDIEKEKVTFIKLDIEGAEIEALKGMEKIIGRMKPKLAISVYHKKGDIVEIPNIILNFREDYQLYLRHYSFWNNDTILYAV